MPKFLDETRLDQLRISWEERRERGDEVPLELLCADCPELLEELKKQIAVLRQWDRWSESSELELAQPNAGGGCITERTAASVALSANMANLKFVARGGLGEVFKARHPGLDRDVAVKLIRPHLVNDAESCRRFEWEARITARLEHPGIVPIYGVGTDGNGHACYGMRLVEGITLAQAITAFHTAASAPRDHFARGKALRSLLSRFKSACVTVAYAHSQHVIHRDLKPENIMLGPFEETLVLDWGLAKLLVPDASRDILESENGDLDGNTRGAPSFQTRGTIGTLGFMSPEQQRGNSDNLGPVADIYSLGVTLYMLLTGKPAFAGLDPIEVAAKVNRGEFAAPRQGNPSVPRALEGICLKAMALRPGDRYRSAQELADDIDNWLADRAVTCLKDPWATRARRWVSRHRTASAALAAAVVVGMSGAALAMYRETAAGIRRQAEARRHAMQVNDLAYANAEKTAREVVSDRRPIWTAQGLRAICRATSIESPLRSSTALRRLAVECLTGLDLTERAKLSTINTACLAFSPDGRRLAIGEHHGEPDFRVVVFDVASQREVANYLLTRPGEDTKRTGVSSLEFSRDGRWLAGGLRNGELLVWDTKRDRLVSMVPIVHSDRIVKLAFTPQSNWLVAGSHDGCASVWDADVGWKNVAVSKLGDQHSHFAISPDGKLLACELGWKCNVFELASFGRIPLAPNFAHQYPSAPHPLAYSPDGHYLVVADPLRDSHTLIDRRKLKGPRELVDPDLGRTHRGEVSHIEFNAAGTLLASSSGDNTLKLWDLAADRLALRMAVLTEAIVCPAFGPDGHTLAVGCSEGTRLYDVLRPDSLTTLGNLPDVVAAFAFVAGFGVERPGVATISELHDDYSSNPLLHVLTRQDGDTCRINWAVDIKEVQRGARLPVGIAAHPDRPIFAVNLKGRIQIYNQRAELLRIDTKENASNLGFSPDGSRLWGLIDEVRVVSWSTTDWSIATTWNDAARDDEPGRTSVACLAARSKWVVAGSRSGRVDIIRAGDSQPKRRFRVSRPVQSIALSPDESLIACGSGTGKLALIGREASEVLTEFAAHQDAVESVDFSPDGPTLVSASTDRTLVLWKVDGGNLTELVRFPAPSGRPIRAARFSPDGRSLGVLVQNEHAVRIFHLDTIRMKLRDLGLDWDDGAP
jgi:WD40 repeat protein